MKGRLTILTTSGERRDFDLAAAPSLELLQKAVGGWIELVPLSWFNRFEGQAAAMFCNEEGKLKASGLVNVAATDLITGRRGIAPDIIVGDVAIVYGDQELMSEL